MKEKSQKMAYNKLLQELTYYKQTYAELKLIMDTTFDQITVTDEKGVLRKVSKSCEKIFGMPEDKIIGRDVYSLSEKGVFRPSITAEVLKSKKKLTIVQETASGRRLLVTGIPVFNEKGKLTSVVNISKDITEHERLQKQLQETEEVLEWYRDEIKRCQIKNKEFVVGNSNSMKKIIDLIEHISSMDTTIMLLGETGVGKSFIAKTIHEMSRRRELPFVQINCGAIPENLIESELFGYEEGAFTGANRKGKKGLLEAAGGGTVFLDEIAELPMRLQVKLLHVLQEKQTYKIGGTKPVDIEARIISATNKDLINLVKEGKFREDLYYRLNIVPIYIPSLRERKEDIPVFINYFLLKSNQKYRLTKKISSKGYKVLSSYGWPGNIRELENTIERLVVVSGKDTIEDNDIFEIFTHIPKYIEELNEFIPLKVAVEEFEKQILLKAIEKYKTTRKVAEVLKIDQSTVVKKIKKIRQESLGDYNKHRF